MRLIESLKARQGSEDSYFRSYLLKEDIARLERVIALARTSADHASFQKGAYFQGWSADDMRTGELLPALTPFLDSVWNFVHGTGSDEEVATAWAALDELRMQRLLGCLSRVPKPVEG
ncbi:MAG TPA: hypothetical protein PK970_06180 [Hyphomicrobiaceae bacterium]|nr:hypothetical protein [Hyphomicrobiaceae bacterium]